MTHDFRPSIQAAYVSSATFFFYIVFILDFFIRFSARIPGMGVIRPTLLLVLIIACLLLSQKDVFKKRVPSNVTAALNALIIYIILTVPFVAFPGSVVKNNLAILLKAIVFFYFTASIVDTPKRLKIFLMVFVGCQIFRVLEPLYLNITTGYWGDKTYLGGGEFASRLAGGPYDVINPNELGFVIATCVPFLHYLLFPRGWKLKLLYAGLMACLLYALILTMSRGAFLALLVVGWMVFKESKSKTPLIIAAILVAIAGWSVMSPMQKDRYLSLVSSDKKGSASKEGRIKGMKKEFALGFERPIFGHGLGTTAESKFHKTGKRQVSHNLYAELLIELGLIGMFMFLRFLSRIYKDISSIRNMTRIGVEAERLQKVLVCLFFMYAVYSINYWGLSQSYWYLLAGLCVAFSRIKRMQGENDLFAPMQEGK